MNLSTNKKASRRRARYTAPALEKGLDVLESLAAERQGMSLQEIANLLGRSPNEIFRMLDVLVQRGYLSRSNEATYALTLRLFELGQRHPLVDRVLDAAMPQMQSLARQTGQSNHLCVHHDRRLVVLARAEPPEPMCCLVRQGAHFAFHDDRVSARVISAFQSSERQPVFVDELAGTVRVSSARRQTIGKRLASIRTRGYDEGPSDTLSGVTDICFPIFDQFGVVAALNVVYLKQRDARVSVPAARKSLQQTTAAISRSLGWRPR